MYTTYEAIKVDQDFFPLQFKGPTGTPPILDYMAPDMEENKEKVSMIKLKIMNPGLLESGKK